MSNQIKASNFDDDDQHINRSNFTETQHGFHIPTIRGRAVKLLIAILALTALMGLRSTMEIKTAPPVKETKLPTLRVAIGMLSVSRPDRTGYLYASLTALISAMSSSNTNDIVFSPINVFAGSVEDESPFKLLRYVDKIKLHPISKTDFEPYKESPVHVKGSYNYQRALNSLSTDYSDYDAIIMLEDDVIVDPLVGNIAVQALREIQKRNITHWLIDGCKLF